VEAVHDLSFAVDLRDSMIPREGVPLLDEDETAIDALAELSAGSSSRTDLAGLLSITDLGRALGVGRPSGPAKV
jgi:hypothetical protein